MVLNFSAGSEISPPQVKLGQFSPGPDHKGELSFSMFSSAKPPPWVEERKKLMDEGYYFENLSGVTYKDLFTISSHSLVRGYENYSPPPSPYGDNLLEDPNLTGFDRSSIIGQAKNAAPPIHTFISSNIVQDFGKIHAAQNYSSALGNGHFVYVEFDSTVGVVPGDRFSIYVSQGEMEHKSSERKGHYYTITGHIQVLKKKEHLWKAKIFGLEEVIYRNDRITRYTPKTGSIADTFNQRRY